MRYERGNVYQAVPASQAEAEYKEQESQYFATFAQEFQKYANKFSAEMGADHGASADETRTIEVEENGQWVKKEVPAYEPHPLAGFTAYGSAYNEAAATNYLARVDTDFIESANRIMTEAGSDVRAFDEFAAAFEEGYFDGMSGQMRAQAKKHWTEYKVKARNKVMVRGQEVALAQNIAGIENSAEVYETIALRAARNMDVDEGSDYRLRYFGMLDNLVELGGADADEVAERKRKFDKAQEEQYHLGMAQYEIGQGRGLQYVSSLIDKKDYVTMDPTEVDSMIDKAWALLADHERALKTAEENDTKAIKQAQDSLFMQLRGQAIQGQAPSIENITNLVQAQRLTAAQGKELQDLRRGIDVDGIDNPNVVRDLENRLYSRTDVPTIPEVLQHAAEGRLARNTANAMIKQIDAEQRNPSAANSDLYRHYIDNLDAAFGIIKQSGGFAAFATNEQDVRKAKRLTAAKREFYERVVGGEDIESAYTIVLQRWHPQGSTPEIEQPNIVRPREREAVRALRDLGIPADEQMIRGMREYP